MQQAWMAGSGEELRNSEDDEATGETILEIEVRGKRGVGYCKSMPGAVRPFERLRDRIRPDTKEKVRTTELLFPLNIKMG